MIPNFIRRLLPKKKQEVKNFSTTMTTSMEGVSAMKNFSPEITAILKKLRKNEQIDNNDLNKVSSYYFNVREIEPGMYGASKPMFDGMCFDIIGVNTVYNPTGDIDNIYLTLKEVVHNLDLTITVSVKDFHEVFNLLTFKPVKTKGASC